MFKFDLFICDGKNGFILVQNPFHAVKRPVFPNSKSLNILDVDELNAIRADSEMALQCKKKISVFFLR